MITCATARNWAPSVRYRTATLPRVTTRNSAAWIGLRRRTSPSAAPTAISATRRKPTVRTSGPPVGRDRHRRAGRAVGSGWLEGEEHLSRIDHPAPAVGREFQD